MRIDKINIRPKSRLILTPPKEKLCPHPQITNLTINKNKIKALLADGREISIPTSWLTEQSVPLTKLQKYEIWDGYEIYWPDLKEVIGVETFTEGLLGACCDYH
ncbi:protein of unknown function (DUF2442 domain) [endosymbiont DhMRE of Dentiscutata heterogama]|uniref:DUF2442 domain-containing protein n=1 Tax=endosymbiont DhMRE of Dentiscutata heterogama TaxID=1609546 RepID=UPI000629D638|nr:DUF2442 domain-containing protein [endosymbiont DhMRE of Dentiscutata heterogama]CFW92781.1 protein of unknown function (DUF2442 domain) [endosymbiont DhMRE of Dentiscutata heterogama]